MELVLSPEAQSCCDDIVRAMQQANQYLERGDYATAGCYQGFIIGYLCGLNQFGKELYQDNDFLYPSVIRLGFHVPRVTDQCITSINNLTDSL